MWAVTFVACLLAPLNQSKYVFFYVWLFNGLACVRVRTISEYLKLINFRNRVKFDDLRASDPRYQV